MLFFLRKGLTVVIVIGGRIGLGKTTTSQILSKELNVPVYYESVEGNKILPLFYSASEEDQQKYRYPFLLQLTFLASRFHSIVEALENDNAILDRSLYEDYYFAKKNHDLGRISDLELETYKGILDERRLGLDKLPKKSPDVMVYLHGSFDTCLQRIKERGRSFEIEPSLVDYYHFLWKDYDSFVTDSYKASPIISVDVDKRDILKNESDRKWLLAQLTPYCRQMPPHSSLTK